MRRVAAIAAAAFVALLVISFAIARSKYPSWADRRWTRSARSPAVSRRSWRSAARASSRSPSPCRTGRAPRRSSRARRVRTAIPTHVVPAFRLRDGTSFSSDAGEPAGSAGAPLLAALAGAGLHDVAAVVVRWYGGTNLGVGGLVRAYGGALRERSRARRSCAASARRTCGCATATS